MMKKSAVAQTCVDLVAAYQREKSARASGKLRFSGVGERDVYNITAPFEDEGELVIAGRVEARNTEFSEVMFFVENGSEWIVRPSSRRFALQDPFVTRIHDELIFGGVRVIEDPHQPGKIQSWVTEFYRGQSVSSLEWFLTGPDRMKDVRLVQTGYGQIGVLTRPQGAVGGRGKIGWMTVESISDLSAQRLSEAPVFDGQFIEEEWGGANEGHLLANGWIGVFGHIARFDEQGNRHYHAMSFALNPLTRQRTELKVIATRADFPQGHAKRPDLQDVLFSGGLVRRGDGTATLYAGLSDAQAGWLTVPDPFLSYESLSIATP